MWIGWDQYGSKWEPGANHKVAGNRSVVLVATLRESGRSSNNLREFSRFETRLQSRMTRRKAVGFHCHSIAGGGGDEQCPLNPAGHVDFVPRLRCRWQGA